MAFEKPKEERVVELAIELGDVVLKAENFETLVGAIKMMGANARESLKRAINVAER